MDVLLAVASLGELLPAVQKGGGWLGGDGRERLAEISHPLRRDQFLAGRVLAGRLLAAVGGGDPVDWRLLREPNGAPLAVHDGKSSELQVSLAHSGNRVACAVSASPLGIDIEHQPRERDVLKIARGLYPRAFVQRLEPADPAERRRLFYRRWTLDEAHAKATRIGLKPKALRRQDWEPAAEGRAHAWLWHLPDAWLAVAGKQLAQPRFRWLTPSPGLPPEAWLATRV